MGLKRALQKEKEKNPTDEELAFEERIAKETIENMEFWLDRLNTHIEKLLEKVVQDNHIMGHVADHYHTRNKICNVKVKQL